MTKFPSLTICRMCLARDVQMYAISNTQFEEIFDILSTIPLQSKDNRPRVVCYICSFLLKKFCDLRTQCMTVENTLTRYFVKNELVPETAPYEIDRRDCKLVTTLTQTDIHILTHTGEDTSQSDSETNVKLEECEPHEEVGDKSNLIEPEADETKDFSESDDNIPLDKYPKEKDIVLNRKVRKKRKINFKNKNEFSLLEKTLSKEEQRLAMEERARSTNYLKATYKCALCYKGFRSAFTYENHKSKHDESMGAFECDLCHMRYTSGRQLRSHVAITHSRQYMCSKCGLRMHTAQQAKEHDDWHRGHTYDCQLCGQKFMKKNSYLTHTRKMHPTEHACPTCGKCFLGRLGLIMHKQKAHRNQVQIKENPSDKASSRFCTECNIQFESDNAWKQHILSSVRHARDIQNSAKCRICGVTVTGTASEHARAHHRELRIKQPTPPRSQTHASEEKFTCDQCGAVFNGHYKLSMHIKRMHDGIKYNKNIVCEVCGKKCNSLATLRYHQRTHTGERPHACYECDKRFSDKFYLTVHLRVHTGERPYECARCGRTFSQRNALNRHHRVHTGAKPYACTYCDKTFSQSNSRKIHEDTIHLKIRSNKKGMEKSLPPAPSNDRAHNTKLNAH